MTDPYDFKVREQLMETDYCKLDEQYEINSSEQTMQTFKNTIVTTLRSAIAVQMARRTIEKATISLKDMKDDFTSRITQPLDRLKKKQEDMGALNSCKWLIEANMMNNIRLKRLKMRRRK